MELEKSVTVDVITVGTMQIQIDLEMNAVVDLERTYVIRVVDFSHIPSEVRASLKEFFLFDFQVLKDPEYFSFKFKIRQDMLIVSPEHSLNLKLNNMLAKYTKKRDELLGRSAHVW